MIVFIKLEETRNGIGNRPADLDRRALSARRTAGKMRGNRAHKGERCHNGRNVPARDRAINHQVIAARSILAVPAIEPRREDANRRQQREADEMGFAKTRNRVKAREKRPSSNAHERCDKRDEREETQALPCVTSPSNRILGERMLASSQVATIVADVRAGAPAPSSSETALPIPTAVSLSFIEVT